MSGGAQHEHRPRINKLADGEDKDGRRSLALAGYIFVFALASSIIIGAYAAWANRQYANQVEEVREENQRQDCLDRREIKEKLLILVEAALETPSSGSEASNAQRRTFISVQRELRQDLEEGDCAVSSNLPP